MRSCRLSTALGSLGFRTLVVDSRECPNFRVLQARNIPVPGGGGPRLWAQSLKDVEQGWAVLSDMKSPPKTGVLTAVVDIRQGPKVRAIETILVCRG